MKHFFFTLASYCIGVGALLAPHSDGSLEKHMYYEINEFRENPEEYVRKNGWKLSCTVPIDHKYNRLKVVRQLELSSSFQAETCASRECEISHETCPQHCHRFGGSCSYIDRIKHFVDGDGFHASNVNEILVSGPKGPHRVLELFIGSPGHCDHILDPNLNAMGANFTHVNRNVFVVDFAYIEELDEQKE